jgi:hypothetical protein
MISGCEVLDVLEAAHIEPYRGAQTHSVDNGLLLRSDLHTLFDLDLIAIEPETLKVHLHPDLQSSEYLMFNGTHLLLTDYSDRPSEKVLSTRWKRFQARLTERT